MLSWFNVPSGWRLWLGLLRGGDVLLLGLACGLVAWSFPRFWTSEGNAEWVQVRQNGQVFAELDIHAPQQIHVPGPLGETLIEIAGGRARVLADPGPRQYCVRQGWLSRNGEVAICAPNQVSLQITGRQKAYDSLAY